MGGAKRRSRKPCETAVRNRRAILMFVIDAEACKWAWFIAHVERILGCSVHIIPQIVHMRMREPCASAQTPTTTTQTTAWAPYMSPSRHVV